MKYIVSGLILVAFFSCRKEKIPYPVEFECAYNSMLFSTDTSLEIPSFYPVKPGNTWNYTVFKYVNDTLDTSYHNFPTNTVTGICYTPDTLWQLNNNSGLIYGNLSNGIFALQSGSSGCLVPQPSLYVPPGSDTMQHVTYNHITSFVTKFYFTPDTVITPAGTFYNPLVAEGNLYGIYFKSYYISGIGMVKSISNYSGSPERFERFLLSYDFY